MTATIDNARHIAEYRDMTMSAFADFSGLNETQRRVARGGARFFESPETARRWAESHTGRRFRFLSAEVTFT